MFTLPIKKFRRMRHLTLDQLSELSGISTSQLSRLEADNVIRNRSTTLLTIEKIALAMEICPYTIIRYDCLQCQLYEKCIRDKVYIDHIIEEDLNFYI